MFREVLEGIIGTILSILSSGLQQIQNNRLMISFIHMHMHMWQYISIRNFISS